MIIMPSAGVSPRTNMAVTVQSWAKSKAKQKFVTIKLQPCKCTQMIFKCIISGFQSSEYIWIRIIYATWTTWACRKLHNEMFPDFCGLALKKRLPNALYQIAWHGALNRVTITQCKTRNSRSPVRHKKSDLQCCCNGKECHPFAHWFFAIHLLECFRVAFAAHFHDQRWQRALSLPGKLQDGSHALTWQTIWQRLSPKTLGRSGSWSK